VKQLQSFQEAHGVRFRQFLSNLQMKRDGENKRAALFERLFHSK
jgi:hypothetical protein